MKKKLKLTALILVSIVIVFLCLMYFVLKNTPEYNIHRMRGAENNVVYISEDGHIEAVFDSSGTLVTDSVNKGSYNYSHPVDDPFGHFFKDILPWLMLGNARDDPTTPFERLSAYNQDLKIGFKRTLGISKNQSNKANEPTSSNAGDSVDTQSEAALL